MANPLTAITRLFRRNPKNALVAELYTRGIGKPLLAHADLGGQLLRGYLAEQATVIEQDDADAPAYAVHDGIGIIDISGGLVSRPMGFCGPVSYEEIGAAFDALLADENVNAIVFRLDSPGGEVSGLFDLADHIYNSRGTKPIFAAVDDMAYSAAYAIASACDRIYLSRTGGVGSIGVVSYHVDQSEYNAKKGIKVDYLYAGDRKVDGNPHAPLSDDARASMQAEIDRLYELFVATVARNRGLDAKTVRETQAACYYGEDAVKHGLADQVQPFMQLMGYLLAGELDDAAREGLEEPEEQEEEETPEEPEAPEPTFPQADAEAVKDNENQEEVLSAEAQDEIRSICAAAGLPSVAKAYIQMGASVEAVREELMEVLTAGETEIQSARSAELNQPVNALDINLIYDKRRGA